MSQVLLTFDPAGFGVTPVAGKLTATVVRPSVSVQVATDVDGATVRPAMTTSTTSTTAGGDVTRPAVHGGDR
jgi:hypothetical protein